MKIALSYFYQIRNFKQNMVPMSTAMGDPAWYHEFQEKHHTFYDKRGIFNGLRLQPIINAATEVCNGLCFGPEQCEATPAQCPFLKAYRSALETVDFDKMMIGIESFAKRYKAEHNIDNEIIMVLIVHEAPKNPCSERLPLIEYFNSHGVECNELQYPIR